MCPDNDIPPANDANKKLLPTSSAAIRLMRSESAVYNAIFLVADNLSVEVLIRTRIMNQYVSFIPSIDRQEFSKRQNTAPCKHPKQAYSRRAGIYER